MGGHFKMELKTFALGTSLKGIPRMVKTKSPILQIIWIFSIMFFFLISLTLSYRLMTDYLQYPTATTIIKHPIDPKQEPATFPVILICNLNPFRSDVPAETYKTVPTAEEFYSKLYEYHNCPDCDDGIDIKHLLGTEGYFQYIGDKNASALSHTYEDLVFLCEALYVDGMSLSRLDCDGIVKVRQNVQRDMYNCYELEVNQRAAPQIILGVNIGLHLDNYEVMNGMRYLSNNIMQQRLGASVTLFETGTLPLITRHGFSLPPGFHADINYHFEKRVRYPYPYSDCLKEPLFEDLPDKKYTYDTCLSFCTETTVANTCSCAESISLNMLRNPGVSSSTWNLPYCQSIQAPRPTLIERMNCSANIRQNMKHNPSCPCKEACSEVIYRSKVSTSHWPADPLIGDFYLSAIKNRSYEWRYDQFYLKNKSDSIHLYEHVLSPDAKELISKNFLTFTVHIESTSFNEYIDEPKYSMTSLISQFGGAVNLWSGITMVLIVEILEFIIRVIFIPTNKKNSLSKSTTKANNVPISTIHKI